MARKVFISFLGFTNYRQCVYFKDDFKSENTRFIQEATLDYLQSLESWEKNDIAYILLTEGAKKKNWVDDGHVDIKTKETIRQPGLLTCLSEKNYPFPIVPVENIPDGNNEQELHEIFGRVYGELGDGDELYFDVTHGFRSLPMLALVLINYAKFLRNITVRSITYGNYEARSHGDDGKEHSPIIDLLPLSQIQDWTFATADFLKNGNADRFAELAEEHRRFVYKGMKKDQAERACATEKLAKSLNAVVDDFLMCRGNGIIGPKHLASLENCLETVKNLVPQHISPIIDKLSDAFSEFSKDISSEQVSNGFEAARWCIEHNLYQQAATILQESVVTFFCARHSLNINDEEQRGLVNQAFRKVQMLESSRTPEEEKKKIQDEISSQVNLAQLAKDELLTDRRIYEAFSMLTDDRNDINHSGMRKEPRPSKKIRENIGRAFQVLYKSLV